MFKIVIIDLDSIEVNIAFGVIPVVIFFFPPLRSRNATAKSSNSVIFKFLLLIQQ